MFGGNKVRTNAQSAGYMELQGAKKDAECAKVQVKGGVSSELGCCNLFEKRFIGVKAFKCGNCEYVKDQTGAR